MAFFSQVARLLGSFLCVAISCFDHLALLFLPLIISLLLAYFTFWSFFSGNLSICFCLFLYAVGEAHCYDNLFGGRIPSVNLGSF